MYLWEPDDTIVDTRGFMCEVDTDELEENGRLILPAKPNGEYRPDLDQLPAREE